MIRCLLMQTTSAYMEQIQEFVPLLCQSAALKPHGVKDMQGSSPSQAAIAALQSASIRCMQAYLQLWCADHRGPDARRLSSGP